MSYIVTHSYRCDLCGKKVAVDPRDAEHKDRLRRMGWRLDKDISPEFNDMCPKCRCNAIVRGDRIYIRKESSK